MLVDTTPDIISDTNILDMTIDRVNKGVGIHSFRWTNSNPFSRAPGHDHYSNSDNNIDSDAGKKECKEKCHSLGLLSIPQG